MQWPMSIQTYFIATLWPVQLHGITSTIFSYALFYESFCILRGFIRFLSWFHSFLDFLLFFSHCSFKKVFLHPVPPLSLTVLCPLSLRLVCHVIKFLLERHLVTLLLAYPALSFHPHPSLSPSVQEPNCYSCLLFESSCSNASFLLLLLSRFLTQDNQERNGTAPTEWPIDWQEILCARKGVFFFPPSMALECQFKPQSGSFAYFWP